MSGRSRKFLQSILTRLSESPILRNATTAMASASGRARDRLSDVRHAAAEKYDTIAKQINATTTVVIRDPNTLPRPIPASLLDWWRWYQRLTGMEDVEAAQQRVVAVQDKLFRCQDKRRVLNDRAAVVAEKLKQVYGELVQTERDDPKYVRLTITENKSLQEQTGIGSQLRLLESEERDCFARLATAIKEYHDSQAMNAQRYKYLSIVASAVLAVVSLCGSMVYNDRRIRDVRAVIADAQRRNETTFKESFGSLEETMATNFGRLYEQLRSSDYATVAAESSDRRTVDPTERFRKNVDAATEGSSSSTVLTQKNIWIGALLLVLCAYISSGGK